MSRTPSPDPPSIRVIPRFISDFAFIEVTAGRRELLRYLSDPTTLSVQVILTGIIERRPHSSDDGTSQEFSIGITAISARHA